MATELLTFDLSVTFNDGSSVGFCIPTDVEPEQFIENAKAYNADMLNVDVGSSRHRRLLMDLMGLEKDALFRIADFYAVKSVEVELIRCQPAILKSYFKNTTDVEWTVELEEVISVANQDDVTVTTLEIL